MNDPVRTLRLVPVVELETELQMKVLEIRNEPGVRRWMYTDHEIGVNEHLAWIHRLKSDAAQIVFAVLDADGTPLGVASVNAIDRRHGKADWAYYLSENARGGLGSALEFAFLDFVFDRVGLDKLNCEVIEGNQPVVRLHQKFGFAEEGFRRSQVVKEGQRVGVHLLGMTRADWQAQRGAVAQRHAAVFARYAFQIEWQPDPAELAPLDQIEKARARNNLNWMSILRLALEKSPATAQPIVVEIKKLDREIASLTDRLTAEQA